MRRARMPWTTVFMAAAFGVVGSDSLRGEAERPRAALTIEGAAGRLALRLSGRDSGRQLVVTGRDAGGRLVDRTRQAAYESTPPGFVRIDPTGWMTPLAEGRVRVRAVDPERRAAVADVVVEHLEPERPVSFANQVVPILTRAGCNAGGCHGKASGQNGFRLSLLGFEPAEDHETIVKEARGRRLFPAAPERSLLLAKATGALPHGGGARLEAGSPSARVLRQWIAQGAPASRPGEPAVLGIEVVPPEREMPRGGTQQLAVLAHLSDGTTTDVTRLAQFEVNDPEMAEVSATGLVTLKRLPGSVAVMARFQAHVSAFSALVPLGAPFAAALPTPRNFIDELVFARLRRLGLPPSDPCDDATFLRRATLDIAGRLPTLAEVDRFLADPDPARDQTLIDRLLASPDYADVFAAKWSAILRNRRRTRDDDPGPSAAFHGWIRDHLNKNTPYDRFVREILTATGDDVTNPPVLWYREVRETSAQVEDSAQLFLGQRIGCAHCHHHPLERWSQQDYFGLAAFFSRVAITDPPPPKKPKKGKGETAPPPPPPRVPFAVSVAAGEARAVHPRTGAAVVPIVLGGDPRPGPPGDDPRRSLADWMVEPGNPYFARALVNRYWKHFFGRGLVDPEDDMRVTNPPSHPELLDALASHFAAHGFDLKDLVRTLATSRVYRLGSEPNAFNGDDRRNGSRYVPKRLGAEVLLDAIDAVTLEPSRFEGVAAGTRAVQLPDNLFDSYFLGAFGRPDSASACECERSSEATLAQCLHMFNSAEILSKVGGPRAARLAADSRPHEARLVELYKVALGRVPSSSELAVLLAHLAARGDRVRDAYEDILWSLINSKEFLFNH